MTAPKRQRLPPYTYLPGHRPHPTRHAEGHSYGTKERPPPPLDPDAWSDSSVYVTGIALFERGYYWEAHEAWEGLWVAAGKEGVIAELLKGLIKLAVAGIKVRQGLPDRVSAFGERAGKHFDRAQALCGQGQLAGLEFADLRAFAGYVAHQGSGLSGSAELAVEVVFDRRLLRTREGEDHG